MTIIKELDALHVNGEEYKFPAGEGDMKYADFSLVEKTGATVTLDLFSYVEPSTNFTVNAPSEIKEGQEYILRVENGATAYTMTLGTNITNPYSASTTLTANGIDQFVFLAVDGILELQPAVCDFDIKDLDDSGGLRNSWTSKQDALTAGSNIQIAQDGTISATDTTYNAGTGIEIKNGPDYSAMQGPAPDGFHVPTITERGNLRTALINSCGRSVSAVETYLKMPNTANRIGGNRYDSQGYYWSASANSTESAHCVHMNGYGGLAVDLMYYVYGQSIRCFKDTSVTPDSSWTELYSNAIYHNSSLGLISIKNGTDWITIQDKNLGATTVYNNGDTQRQSNCGCLYQWGNNYGFAYSGSISYYTTQVDARNYGPGNYYSGNKFIGNLASVHNWDSSNNKNLWGGVTGVVTINNVITNTGVLSVNGQTGDVTIQTGGTYTAGDGINISNQNVISVDGTQAGVLVYSLPQHPISLQDEYVYSGTATLGGNTSEIDIFTNRVAIKNDTTGGDQNRVYLDIYQGKGELYVKDKINNVTTEAEYMSDKILSTGANTETYEFQGGGNNQIARLSDLSGKQDKATSGSTAPSTTPTYVGQQYVDTTNDKMYIATGTSSSSDWMEVGAGSGDMLYADFNWVTKTGATITLDLNSYIEPSADFTVNAPSTIEDGQRYILRVVTGATPYTMTLGTGITNPYSESTTLLANTVHQFGFLAVDGNLELQPSVTQSGGGTWGTITGTLSNQTDLQTALNAKANATDLNTKAFYLTGTTGQANLDTATAAMNRYASGKCPIIMYKKGMGYISYVLGYRFSSGADFYSFGQVSGVSNGITRQNFYKIRFNTGEGSTTVSSIEDVTDVYASYLSPYYSSSSGYFTPTSNSHPATKKYVDDNVAYVGSSAPSSPTEGRLWYDTANDVLKSYDGTNWNECGGGINKSWVTKTVSSGEIELGIRTLVNDPSANFTLTKPATLIDGEEYAIRINSGSTARTMTLGTGFTNPWNVSLSLNAQATDQFVFLAINNTLELQPLITIS